MASPRRSLALAAASVALLAGPAAADHLVDLEPILYCDALYEAASGDAVLLHCSVVPQEPSNPVLPGTGAAFAVCADGLAVWGVVLGTYGDTRRIPFVSGCWPAP